MTSEYGNKLLQMQILLGENKTTNSFLFGAGYSGCQAAENKQAPPAWGDSHPVQQETRHSEHIHGAVHAEGQQPS